MLGRTMLVTMYSAGWCVVGNAAGIAGLDHLADCLCFALHLSRGSGAQRPPHGEGAVARGPPTGYTGKALSGATGYRLYVLTLGFVFTANHCYCVLIAAAPTAQPRGC